MLRRYQDIALRLAARLAKREDLGPLDLRVLEAYFNLASDDREPSPPAPRDQTRMPGETHPPKGCLSALPLPLLLCKAQPAVQGDPILLGGMVVFFSYVAVLLWRSR